MDPEPSQQSERSLAPRLEQARRLHWLVRAGFVARGLTYGIIGALALTLALAAGGGLATNQQEALALLAETPLGEAALVAVAVGLLAYALWKFALSVVGLGPEGGGGNRRPTGCETSPAASRTAVSSLSLSAF